jgi:hypothetical protein
MSTENKNNPSLKYLVTTPTEVSIHRLDENPIFGRSATKIRVQDEAGGPFIVLTQCFEDSEGKLSFDLDELEEVLIQARKLIASYPINK